MERTAPHFPVLVPGDVVTWEAHYDDGTFIAERNGARYAQIDRDRLSRFVLVSPGEMLIEVPVPEGGTGWNLIYRRRTMNNPGKGRRVLFLIAWAPMGPALLIDPAKGTLREEAAFIEGDPDMYPPDFIADEGENRILDELTRAS